MSEEVVIRARILIVQGLESTEVAHVPAKAEPAAAYGRNAPLFLLITTLPNSVCTLEM